MYYEVAFGSDAGETCVDGIRPACKAGRYVGRGRVHMHRVRSAADFFVVRRAAVSGHDPYRFVADDGPEPFEVVEERRARQRDAAVWTGELGAREMRCHSEISHRSARS